MIFIESKLKVADNSGGVYVKCVKVPGSSKPRFGRTGDLIVVSVRVVKPKLNIKIAKRIVKGGLYKAILIRTKKPFHFYDGSYVKFYTNEVVLIRKAQARTFGGPKLAGNRVFGPVAYLPKLRKQFPKLFSLASKVFKAC